MMRPGFLRPRTTCEGIYDYAAQPPFKAELSVRPPEGQYIHIDTEIGLCVMASALTGTGSPRPEVIKVGRALADHIEMQRSAVNKIEAFKNGFNFSQLTYNRHEGTIPGKSRLGLTALLIFQDGTQTRLAYGIAGPGAIAIQTGDGHGLHTDVITQKNHSNEKFLGIGKKDQTHIADADVNVIDIKPQDRIALVPPAAYDDDTKTPTVETIAEALYEPELDRTARRFRSFGNALREQATVVLDVLKRPGQAVGTVVTQGAARATTEVLALQQVLAAQAARAEQARGRRKKRTIGAGAIATLAVAGTGAWLSSKGHDVIPFTDGGSKTVHGHATGSLVHAHTPRAPQQGGTLPTAPPAATGDHLAHFRVQPGSGNEQEIHDLGHRLVGQQFTGADAHRVYVATQHKFGTSHIINLTGHKGPDYYKVGSDARLVEPGRARFASPRVQAFISRAIRHQVG